MISCNSDRNVFSSQILYTYVHTPQSREMLSETLIWGKKRKKKQLLMENTYVFNSIFCIDMFFAGQSEPSFRTNTHFQFMNFAQKGLWIPQKASVQKLFHMV